MIKVVTRYESTVLSNGFIGLSLGMRATLKTIVLRLGTIDSRLRTTKDMAFPVRPVFTPFVVVVGGKYFFPVPECLLFDQEIFLQETIFYCA